jgi:hypothetical protein
MAAKKLMTKQQKNASLEKQFARRAAKVPLNKMLFDDPVIKRIVRSLDRLHNIT